MTRTELERLVALEEGLARVESDVAEIKGCIGSIDDKLTEAIINKADKDDFKRLSDTKASQDDFKDLRGLVIGVLVASAAFAITTLVGLFVYLTQGHIVTK